MRTREEYGKCIPDLVPQATLVRRMLSLGPTWTYSILETNPSILNSTGFGDSEVVGVKTVDIPDEIEKEKATGASRDAMRTLRKQREGNHATEREPKCARGQG